MEQEVNSQFRNNLMSPLTSGYCKMHSCPSVPSFVSFLGGCPSVPSPSPPQLVLSKCVSPLFSPPRDDPSSATPSSRFVWKSVSLSSKEFYNVSVNVIDFDFLKHG
ncbi:hypothetical protein TNCV_513051 [Trichonephila clavipes]|nr:hypothetical protein TNCV_513051 [Trichonephila clavipes]